MKEYTPPGFLHGTEVAQSRRIRQPAFDQQLSLIERQQGLKKKLTVAVVVIVSVFLGGLVAGAVAGIFI